MTNTLASNAAEWLAALRNLADEKMVYAFLECHCGGVNEWNRLKCLREELEELEWRVVKRMRPHFGTARTNFQGFRALILPEQQSHPAVEAIEAIAVPAAGEGPALPTDQGGCREGRCAGQALQDHKPAVHEG